MFKKLKDKIAEEVRQAPLRLPASVQQQLSQYSAFTRESQIADNLEVDAHFNGEKDSNASNENFKTLVDIAEDSEEAGYNQFSIGEDDNNTPSASPSKNSMAQSNEFQAVNLNEFQRENISSTPLPTGMLSRQPSLNSVHSDVSFMGGAESSYHPYQFQSDLESNISEFDDSASGQHVGERISKEHIFLAFQKMRGRYHKYKGRYADLARHYKELEREREKVKHLLTDTQDRSLRRISELREQCALEQQAKAHLEENLRSDLEEKDNIIAVLQTKVKLLASGSLKSSDGVLVDVSSSEIKDQVSSCDESVNNDEEGKTAEDSEVQVMKEKLQRFESLLVKCKENIKNQKGRIAQLQSENETIKRSEASKQAEIDKLLDQHKIQLAQLTDSLNFARQEIETLRRQEQDAALAAAETKQKVHGELLHQEAEVIKLRAEREHLQAKIAQTEAETRRVKDEMTRQLQEAEMILENEKQRLLKELSRGKTEALKLMDEDMDNRLEELKREKDSQWEIVLQKKLAEADEHHQRTLRLAEEQLRSRLVEIQEEKDIALEEKELRYKSLISQEQSVYKNLQEEVSALKLEIEEKEKMISKIKDEGLKERQSWVQQIEDNRLRHLEEVEQINQTHHQLVEKRETEYNNHMGTAILNLKELHRKELEKVQQQHEELLQAANEDVENSAKSQMDQYLSLLRDRESELNQKNANLKQLEEQVKLKDQNISDLDGQVAKLRLQLEENEVLAQQLEQSIQQCQQLESHNRELESAKNDLLSSPNTQEMQLDAAIQSQLDERTAQCSELEHSLKELENQLADKETQMSAVIDERNAKYSELEQSFKDLENKFTEKEAKLLAAESEYQICRKLVETVQNNLETLSKTLHDKEETITALQGQIEGLSSDFSSNDSKWQAEVDAKEKAIVDLQQVVDAKESENAKLVDEKDQQLRTIENELDQLKKALSSNEDKWKAEVEGREKTVADLQQDVKRLKSLVDAKESDCARLVDEKDQKLRAKENEVDQLKQALSAKESSILKLQENIELSSSTISSFESEWKRSLDKKQKHIVMVEAEVEFQKRAVGEKEAQILQFQEEIAKLRQEKDQISEEKNRLLGETETMKQTLETSESCIQDLRGFQQMLEETSQQLKVKEADLGRMSEEFLQVQTDLEKLRQLESALRQQLADKESQEQRITADKKQLSEALASKNEEDVRQKTELERLNQTVDQERSEREALVKKLEQVSGDLQSLSAEKDELDSEYAKLKEEFDAAAAAHSRSNESNQDAAETQNKTFSDQINTLTDEKNRLETLCKRLKAQLIDTKKMLAGKTDAKSNNDCKEELEAAQSTIVQLKEELSAAIAHREHVESNIKQQPLLMANQSESDGLLQQQLAMLQMEFDSTRNKYKMEVTELKRLVELGKASSSANNFHGSLEEATELEYLRNILFEYMMGRQPATLAKVVAAVVKFTPEQTRKIQEREEQRQGLLGQLGFA